MFTLSLLFEKYNKNTTVVIEKGSKDFIWMLKSSFKIKYPDCHIQSKYSSDIFICIS